MKTYNLDNLRTILHSLDKDSDLYNSQAEVCALVEQLESNSYTIYKQDFGDSTWEYECGSLGVPKEAMEVKIGFLVKEVKIDTADIAKRFSLDNKLVCCENGFIDYLDLENHENIQIAHIEGDKLVYDINPIFQIGETFTLNITETYTITGYDFSDYNSNGIAYFGDNGEAWITENALIEQKAIAKIGDKFEIHFDYYETGELTEHTITRIDFSKTESPEVLYCDDNTQVYIAESELLKYKASTHFAIVNENQYRVVSGRYYPDGDDMERFLKESNPCFTGGGKFYIENDDIGTFYRDRGFDAEFLARSAFCVRAIPIGETSATFLVHSEVLDSILKNEITTTAQLENLVSLVNDSPTLEQGMSVGQLIAELQKLDPDKLVTIVVGDEDENIVDTRHFELHATDDGVEYLELFVPVKL